MKDPIHLTIFGDIHSRWNQNDNEFYGQHPTDLILWTGDLGKSGQEADLCRQLTQLGPHSLGILGNHDGASMPLIIAEALGQNLPAKMMAPKHSEKVQGLRNILGDHDLGFRGVDLPELAVTVIGMRPHSTGGERMHFPWTLDSVYNTSNVLERHQQNIDAAAFQDLIFIGHNGPKGLGDLPTSPFGVDFRSGGGDHGDPDYEAAILYAQAQGKRVLLSIGGHMHDLLHPKSKHLGSRSLFGDLHNTAVLNACCIPRVKRSATEEKHQHTTVIIERASERLSIHRDYWFTSSKGSERQTIYDGPLSP